MGPSGRHARWHRRIACAAATLAVCVAPAAAQPGEPRDRPVMNDLAPLITFTTVFGIVETPEDLFANESLFLIFATSQTIGEVIALQKDLAPLAAAGLPAMVVDVDCFTSRHDAKKRWEEAGLILPLRFDAGDLAARYDVRGVPFVVMRDSGGVLRYRGGTGRARQGKVQVGWLAQEMVYGKRPSVQALPVGDTRLMHLPKCSGVRK